MKTYKLASLLVVGLFLCVYAFILPNCRGDEADDAVAKQKKDIGLSFETLGVIRYQDLKGPATYGAGVDVGYAFNRYVSGHARLVAYETDNWGGTAIDEGALLVEARLFGSANGRLKLSAIGGGHRDFITDDWGFGVGLRGTATVYKRLSLFAQGEIRAWFSQPKDGLVSAGLQLSF